MLWGADVVLERFEPFELPEGPPARGHARAGFRADVTIERDRQRTTASLVASGVGLGYFGRHVVAVADALPGLVPDVVGFHDGVVLREWLPETARVPLDDGARVHLAVRYVTTRRAALPARRDAASSMAGQQPVWEVASRILAAPYGAAGLAVRSAALDAAVRTLLAPPVPSVIDGQTGARSWFESEGSLVKVSFAKRSFSNLDLACYDAGYDVAGLALGTTSLELADVARSAFGSETGAPIDPERWLLYRLVHLWDLRRVDQLPAYDAETAAARVWQEWARDRLLRAPLDHGRGPWCALDIDGVLETSRLGAPVLTPSAASGLCALDAHDYRIVLATGRGVAELKDRCARYGLVGGVAEYGAVAYLHGARVERVLLDDAQRAAVAACAERLSSNEGVQLADGCLGSVRAFRLAADGTRVRIDAALVAEALDAARGALRAHEGVAQVDFVPNGVDKAHGLTELLGLLGAPDDVPAVAVGDTAADLEMLRLAARGFVPAHARDLAGGSVRATRHGYQRGFREAVNEVIGHAPAGCATCRSDVPAPEGGAALLNAVLSGLEGGRERGAAAVPQILRHARRLAHGRAPH
jgi:hydroxymethylpyrimidine pyrophosphatase-like HAD family hydrolase